MPPKKDKKNPPNKDASDPQTTTIQVNNPQVTTEQSAAISTESPLAQAQARAQATQVTESQVSNVAQSQVVQVVESKAPSPQLDNNKVNPSSTDSFGLSASFDSNSGQSQPVNRNQDVHISNTSGGQDRIGQFNNYSNSNITSTTILNTDSTPPISASSSAPNTLLNQTDPTDHMAAPTVSLSHPPSFNLIGWLIAGAIITALITAATLLYRTQRARRRSLAVKSPRPLSAVNLTGKDDPPSPTEKCSMYDPHSPAQEKTCPLPDSPVKSDFIFPNKGISTGRQFSLAYSIDESHLSYKPRSNSVDISMCGDTIFNFKSKLYQLEEDSESK
jgi:hypothetical protein